MDLRRDKGREPAQDVERIEKERSNDPIPISFN
jgi:hypothetical protein